MIDFFIKNRISRLIHNQKRKNCFKNLDTIKTILILYNTSEYKRVNEFAKKLTHLGKTVSMCGYVEKEDTTNYTANANKLFLYPKEHINWLKMPTSSFFNQLSANQYDTVIDLTLIENLTMEYLLLSIACPFKIGLEKKDKQLYDFSLSCEKMPLDGQSLDYWANLFDLLFKLTV